MENEVNKQEVNTDEVVIPDRVDRTKVRGGEGNPMQPPPSLNIKSLRRQRTPEEQQAVHERMEAIRKENKEKLEEAIEGIRKDNNKVLDRLRPILPPPSLSSRHTWVSGSMCVPPRVMT